LNKINLLTFDWLMVLGYVIFNSIGALSVKYAIGRAGKIPLDSMGSAVSYFLKLLMSPVLDLGIVSIAVSIIMWIMALSNLQISQAYPVAVGLNFLVVLIMALIFLNEKMTLGKAIGVLLLLISVFLISRSK
jgi:multidrug transporter EmrE-like cation transporter